MAVRTMLTGMDFSSYQKVFNMTIQTKYLRTSDGQLIDTKNLVDSADLGESAFSDFAPGSSVGLALREGSYGLGGVTIQNRADNLDDGSLRTGIYDYSSGTPGSPHTGPGAFIPLRRINSNNVTQLAFRTVGSGTSDVMYVRAITPTTVGPWGEAVLIGINAEVDGNGFYIASSPVIKLYSDRLEDNGQVPNGVEFTRKGVGDYSIAGTLGLATDNKGTIFPLKDINGNVEVHIESTYTDGVLQIKTSAPDYSAGYCAAGEPVDIPEGRFIAIRLHEEPAVEDEEEREEVIEPEQEFMGD